MIVSLRVGKTPLFIVGIEQGKQELPYSILADTLLLIVSKSKFRILSLGKLSLSARFLIYFHKSSSMTVYRLLPAESIEELNVHRQRRYPLLTTYNVC